MTLEIINPTPRYQKVHLLEPAPLGYPHLAADVQAAHRPGPVLWRSRDKQQLFGVLKCPRQSRNTALFALAANVPAAILANTRVSKNPLRRPGSGAVAWAVGLPAPR